MKVKVTGSQWKQFISGPTVAGALRNWLKAQSTCAFIVEVDKAKRDELVELIKQNGGKVINKAIS